MHEVHAPEHPFNSLKEFLFHILTISLGILVALGADAAVDRYHHHELVEETRAAFQSQIDDNRKVVLDNQKATAQTDAHLSQSIALLDTDFMRAKELLRDAPHDFLDLDTGSWDPAVATGALNYMKLAEVRKYSQIHDVEQSLNKLGHEDEEIWLQMGEFNEQASELDKGDLRSMRKLLRKAALYSKWIGIREQRLLKLYEQAAS